jgi:hypothetical protein
VHPELIQALAREHHADLIRPRRARRPDGQQPVGRTVRGNGPTRRARSSVGLALIVVGQRLLRGTSAPVELPNVQRS